MIIIFINYREISVSLRIIFRNTNNSMETLEKLFSRYSLDSTSTETFILILLE